MQIDTMKQWYLPKTLWVLPVLFGLLALTDMLNMNFQHEAQKEEINIRINSISGDKASVSDGENPEAVVKGHKMSNQDSVFEPEKETGYVIKKLTRGKNDTFTVETINAGRIQFPGQGKLAVNHESNFQEYYNGAYNYYTKDDQTGSFSHGKLNDINSFPTLKNKYWAINPVAPKTIPPPDSCANLTSANARIYDHKNVQKYMVTDITKKFPVEERSLIGLTFAGLAFFLVLAGFLNPDYFERPVSVKSVTK